MRSGRDCSGCSRGYRYRDTADRGGCSVLTVVASEVVQPRPGKRESHRGERDAGDQRRADRACPKGSAAGPPVGSYKAWQPAQVDEEVDSEGERPDDEARLVQADDHPAAAERDHQDAGAEHADRG